MTPAKFNPAWVDPFATATLIITQEQPADATVTSAEAASASDISPDQFSIVLGGIFVGAKSRVVTINGEACHEGDAITVTGKDDKSLVQKLRIVQIRRQGVIVDIGSHLLTLELSPPSLAKGDEIQRQKQDTP
jgi:hypothetical protein